MEPQEQEPRVASLHALMLDIGALRRRLETDLTLTAAALEHGELVVADELLGDSLHAVEGFELQGLGHLDETPAWGAPVTWIAPPSAARRRGRAVAVAASIAALSLVLQAAPASQSSEVLAGALPADLTVTVLPASSVDLEQTFADLSDLETSPHKLKPVQITAVATKLFAQVTEIKGAKVVNRVKARAALSALMQQDKILVANNTDNVLGDLVKQNTLMIDTLTQTLAAIADGLLPQTPPTTALSGLLGQVLGTP